LIPYVGRTGYAEAAFALAEKYRDFSSLAALCHRDAVYPPHENPNASRIQVYIERFKDEFITELYRWYIQHGEGSSTWAVLRTD
jgi:nuclear pore complex protein Nup133